MSLVAHRSGRSARWMSIHEAASLVGVSPATLRRWCVAGDVQAYTTPGGHRRFSRQSIIQLLPAEPAVVTDGQLERVGAELIRNVRLASRRIAAGPPWSFALSAEDRDELDVLSSQMIAGIVAALSGVLGRRRGDAVGHAAAMCCGEIVGLRGIDLDAMIDAGLFLHGLVVHEAAEAADRLGLDAPTATRWVDVAATCAGSFLGDAMRGHATGRRARLPGPGQGDGP